MFPSVGAVRKSGTTVIIEDVAFPIDGLADAAIDLNGLFRKHGYDEGIIFGHARDGNLKRLERRTLRASAQRCRPHQRAASRERRGRPEGPKGNTARVPPRIHYSNPVLRRFAPQNERFTSAPISPTIPRRNTRTHAMKTPPVMTVTHEP